MAVDIRWPNDLLLNGRKCGGILVETAVEGTTMLRYAVIGVGINVNHAAFPAEIGGAGDLAAHGERRRGFAGGAFDCAAACAG